MKTRGLVLGKFWPPHKGHDYLIRFAETYCWDVDVVIGVLPSETFQFHRIQALKNQYEFTGHNNIKVCVIDEDLPQYPKDDNDTEFWDIWKKALIDATDGRYGSSITHVFASESYGQRLADMIGATFVPVDIHRQSFPISGTVTRKDISKNWKNLIPAFRQRLITSICVFGPESAGKTTFSKELSNALGENAVFMPEWARGYLETKGNIPVYEDMEIIGRGHNAAIGALRGGVVPGIYDPPEFIVSDTDALTTIMWSEILYGKYPEVLDNITYAQHWDITFLMDDNIPLEADPQRYGDGIRQATMEHCTRLLDKWEREYYLLTGSVQDRVNQAIVILTQKGFIHV